MKINEISKVDEEWYNPLSWFKKKPRVKADAKSAPVAKTVAKTVVAPVAKTVVAPVAKTDLTKLLPPVLGIKKAGKQVQDHKNKTQQALDALKKEMGTESTNTISSRQNYNISDKGGKEKSSYTQHIRDFDHEKGLSTLTIAQQQDGSTSSRFIQPGGSGVATKNGVEKKIQMKGPQSWAYDKPKVNASKKVKEGDMEADKKNPHAQPYLNTPEWKMLHDMDDKIISAYIKHKSMARSAGRGIKKGLKKLSRLGSKNVSTSWDDDRHATTTTTYNEETKLDEFTISDLKGMGINPTRKQLHYLQKINHENGGNITRSDLRKVGINEQGVIVPGVNTTVDVKPGQTEIEAAKFGNGKIKPLMPKGKSNSHILFNLGLAEDK